MRLEKRRVRFGKRSVKCSGVMFSSVSAEHATPEWLLVKLDAEFGFTLDPCPVGAVWDGRLICWAGHRVFCNPPYGRGISSWLAKASEAVVAVYLLPARTDTKWFHEQVLRAREVRFVRGRLRFGGAVHNAPFPSLVAVFDNRREGAEDKPVGASGGHR